MSDEKYLEKDLLGNYHLTDSPPVGEIFPTKYRVEKQFIGDRLELRDAAMPFGGPQFELEKNLYGDGYSIHPPGNGFSFSGGYYGGGSIFARNAPAASRAWNARSGAERFWVWALWCPACLLVLVFGYAALGWGLAFLVDGSTTIAAAAFGALGAAGGVEWVVRRSSHRSFNTEWRKEGWKSDGDPVGAPLVWVPLMIVFWPPIAVVAAIFVGGVGGALLVAFGYGVLVFAGGYLSSFLYGEFHPGAALIVGPYLVALPLGFDLVRSGLARVLGAPSSGKWVRLAGAAALTGIVVVPTWFVAAGWISQGFDERPSSAAPVGLSSTVPKRVIGFNDQGTATSPGTTRAPSVPAAGLGVDGSLTRGAQIISSSGGYRATFQTDGNFVIYTTAGRALWATQTEGDADLLVMQSDGNLVIYGRDRVVWASGTAGNGPSSLVLQPDGNLVIYRADGRALWASGTEGGRDRLQSPSGFRL
jgi:hypothetical protein